MSETKSSFDEPGAHFETAAGFGFEDAMQRRLRYHLLRLTVVGLTREDVKDLGELARLAFDDADVTEQATKITQRADTSRLASAIAEIAERASRGVGGPVRISSVLLGAVLGAHTALRDAGKPEEHADAAIAGAVGGAVAASVSGVILANIDQVGVTEYVRMEEED